MYLVDLAPVGSVVVDESSKGNDATLVESYACVFNGIEELTISDLAGTETILSNEGTAVGTVSAGKISFTAGTLWSLKLSNGAIYPIAEGAEVILYNTGIGANALVTGAVLNDFRAGRQDVYHYNIREGFDLWTDGSGNEIKVPIGKTCETAGYTLASTNPAGSFNNRSETGIKPPDSLSDIQDLVPISSLTRNPDLDWIDGELDEFDIIVAGTSKITEEASSTRFYSPVGESCYISYDYQVTSGKKYNYYVENVVSEGNLKLLIGGTTVLADGKNEGSFTATVSSGFIQLSRNIGVTDIEVYEFYVWEAGTVPPLFYKNFERNFNDAFLVFSDTKENQKGTILLYNTPQSGYILDKIYKCIGYVLVIFGLDYRTGLNSFNWFF